MENFIEYSLPYRLTGGDWIKRMGLTAAILLIGAVALMLHPLIGMVVAVVCVYVSYKVYVSFNYELEYTLLENEITFTKVINKERRREVLKADITKTESYGLIDRMPSNVGAVRSFLSHEGELPEYFWITQKKNGEKVCILFQPDERILNVFAVRARGKLQ